MTDIKLIYKNKKKKNNKTFDHMPMHLLSDSPTVLFGLTKKILFYRSCDEPIYLRFVGIGIYELFFTDE